MVGGVEEKFAAVRDYGAWNSMETNHFLRKNCCHCHCSEGVFEANKMSIFAQAVHDFQNSVPSL